MTIERLELPPALQARYRLGGDLGKGSQGLVRVLHPLTGGDDLAIKFLLKNDDYDAERFRREIEALTSLCHPNVLSILEHGVEPVPFYVAPKGEPLNKHWGAVRERLDAAELFERSADVITQLARGLSAVHQKDLVHRDIKPKNILVFDETRPVLADFGIVHIPIEERITTRPAGNQFARDLGSLYNPSLAHPAGDCLCLANLWAWMLALDPQLHHGNYHWRFHTFVADERCEIARSVLALCSEPSACPTNGAEFLDLLEKRFLLAKVALPRAPADAADAERAYALAVADSERTRVALRSEIEVLAFAILPSIQPVIAALRLAASDITSKDMPADLHVLGLSEPVRSEEILRAIAGSERARLPHRMAYVRCGSEHVMDFGVNVYMVWHTNPHEDRSKFSLHIQFFHESAPEIDKMKSTWNKVLPSGELEHFDPATAASKIRDFLADASMWVARTKPRSRPPGAFL